jgi:hypothetical protein
MNLYLSLPRATFHPTTSNPIQQSRMITLQFGSISDTPFYCKFTGPLVLPKEFIHILDQDDTLQPNK